MQPPLVLLHILLGFSIFATAIPDRQHHRTLHKDAGSEDLLHADSHDAFLRDDDKTFDHLTPVESSRRLAIIVDKIDKDQDGYVTREELKDWIAYTLQRYIRDDVERQWRSHNPEGKETLSWLDYKTLVYGDMDIDRLGEPDDSASYLTMLKRDRRRWTAADYDGDDTLSKQEFAAFLHAEDVERMKDVIVLETIEDIDKDRDEKISLAEYIGDMYRGNEGEEEPDWVKNEREQFSVYRDKDGDGFLNADEVKAWILPTGFNHAEAESRHLIYEADTDADNKLTKAEILNKYDIFIGSQATDFGEALTRHDEF